MKRSRNWIVVFLITIALFNGDTADRSIASDRSKASRHHLRFGQSVGLVDASTSTSPLVSERTFYRNGRMTGKLVFWNNQPWERTLIEYLDELSLYSVQTMVYHGEKLSLVRKDLFDTSGTGGRPDRKIESWYYYFDKDRTNALRQVDSYYSNTSLVKERQLFDASGGLNATAIFEYDSNPAQYGHDENEELGALTRMTLIDEEGDIVSDYRETTDVDLKTLFTKLGLSFHEIDLRLRLSRDASRTPVLIMDGGIDISHPELAHKMWRNPGEMANGRDDDGNGLVDDIYGISDNPRLGHPVQDLRLPRYGLPRLSHGTLVASIASQGRDDVAIMAASEITTINSTALIPRIERLINSHGVRFTTMSFIFDRQLLTMGAGAQRPHQLDQLIRNTPHTLHVAAAGNGAPINGKGFNVDRYRQEKGLVPAMLPHDNLLVVGAIDTDRLEFEDLATYRLADFSNVGELSVDILAPGSRLCGARMGGGIICESGTSFAAPYLLNHGVLSVAEANPDLTIYEIKEILMKTAYIPDLDHPFPVRSGGILHPGRAVAAARWMAAHPEDSVHSAVLTVRKAEISPLQGEGNDPAYLNALHAFWRLRRIGHTASLHARTKN